MSGCVLCGNPGIPGAQKPQNFCQLSNVNSCSPCRQMREIEAQIHESKNAMEKLVARHRELREEANRAHTHTVFRISEIASMIFQLCLSEELPEITPSTDRSDLAAPLTLGAVCRRWRQIAWSTPRLWSCICIYLNPLKFPARSKQVQQWLTRSGQLPLSINFRTDTAIDNDPYEDGIFDQLFDIINGYSSRWFYLNLEIFPRMFSRFVGDSQGVSILRTLKICAEDDFETGQFRLTDGRPAPSNAEFLYIRLKAVDIAWDNMTHVQVTLFSIDECIELLWRASKLIQCGFSNVLPQENYFTIPSNPVIAPRLQTLYFQTFNSQPDLFFEHITLPSLQRFDLDMGLEHLPIEGLRSLFRRSCFSLRHLSIDNTSFHNAQVDELLRTTISLRTLRLGPGIWQSDNFFRLLATTSRISQNEQDIGEPFLPELRSITLLPQGPIAWSLVPDIFGPISEIENSHRRPLQQLDIIFDRLEYDPWFHEIDKETIPRLLELLDAGISLNLLLRNSGGSRDLLQLSMETHGIMKEEDSVSSPESSFQG